MQKIRMLSAEHTVSIGSGSTILEGDLSVPANAKGIVIFAHGSGSSRHSPRNKYVARVIQSNKQATLLFDLLTKEEEEEEKWTRHIRFDIPLLTRRLINTTNWIRQYAETRNLKIGYFGASTGAAAALVASSRLPNIVEAVISRGGRPDLADISELVKVTAATLLIVGQMDTIVIELNKKALRYLDNAKNKKLIFIPGASHLFEEPGTLEAVAQFASNWFFKYLS
jgi:putative phosphoribosyl transferase